MSVVMQSNAAQIRTALQSLALEIALLEPGTTGGVAEIEQVFETLVNLLPAGSAHEFAAMVEAGHQIGRLRLARPSCGLRHFGKAEHTGHIPGLLGPVDQHVLP